MQEGQAQGPQSGWEFSPDGSATYGDQQPALAHAPEAIAWTASEFIAHEKDMSWYVGIGAVAALLIFAVFLLTRDIISVVMIVVVVIFFAVFAARKPRILPYRVDENGIHIGEKSYPYELFKTFSLVQEGAIRSIMLMPMKRFMPPISMYMDPADEDKILDVLAAYLPFEQREQDIVERVMRRLRF